MKNKKIIKILTISFFVLFSFFVQIVVYAQGPTLVPGGGTQDPKYASGNYEINDFVLIAVNVSEWVLILAGSLSLLAFVVGGLMFILSSGNRELVEKGKNSLIGATIGLAIVFLAFTAINYFMQKMGYDHASFGGAWNISN